MSVASILRAKSQFRVLYLSTKVGGNRVEACWQDYHCRSFTYMSACEEVEKLSGQFGDSYRFKVLHEKLVGKEN
jgi:hypothetical protein